MGVKVKCCSLVLALSLAVGAESKGNGNPLPQFVFPEEGDVFFGENVDVVKSSLQLAVGQGCLESWPKTEPTEIAFVFGHDSTIPATSDFFIQYQMEQVAAAQAQADMGFVSFANHPEYKQKLAEALQIWEWSPHQLDFLKTELPREVSGKLSYVPLWASMDATDCDEILELPSCKALPSTDVLFFGAMTESRKQLCNSVKAEMDGLGLNVTHECVSGIFGTAMKCRVCNAKVIYNEHSREAAVLEVHRINPLLALGKAVVSARSADSTMDLKYSGAVELTSHDKLPQAVARLMQNATARIDLEWHAQNFARELEREGQSHVCQALRSLASMAKDSHLPEKSAGAGQALALRRLANNNSNNSVAIGVGVGVGVGVPLALGLGLGLGLGLPAAGQAGAPVATDGAPVATVDHAVGNDVVEVKDEVLDKPLPDLQSTWNIKSAMILAGCAPALAMTLWVIRTASRAMREVEDASQRPEAVSLTTDFQVSELEAPA